MQPMHDDRDDVIRGLEEELQHARRKLALLYRQAPVGVIEWDGNFARPIRDFDLVRLRAELERHGLPPVGARLLDAALTQVPHSASHLALLGRERLSLGRFLARQTSPHINSRALDLASNWRFRLRCLLFRPETSSVLMESRLMSATDSCGWSEMAVPMCHRESGISSPP